MRLSVLSITDVPAVQLCCGCGACAAVAPEALEMVDVAEHGVRPRRRAGVAALAREVDEQALAVCPGVHLEHDFDRDEPGLIRSLEEDWGPVHEVLEGYAADEEIRFAGSSGGASSAIALYCLERMGMHGVVHIAPREDVPYLNRTVMSTTRRELLARTGSRYAPASPCDGLGLIEQAPAACVFIGKPCDVAAVHKARKRRPELDARLGVTIAFFCAGTPSTHGTLELLRRMGVEDPDRLVSLRYRGNGWPGRATAVVRTAAGGQEDRSLSYEQSWGEVLTRHKQWRCNLCPDHTGEFADIAVGDPWYRELQPGEPGQSLILARTRRGGEIIRAAEAAGYLIIERSDPALLPASQPNLLAARGAVWGRRAVLRWTGAAVPSYPGFRLFGAWRRALSMKQKAQSFYGTVKRVFTRKLRRKLDLPPSSAFPESEPDS